MVELTAKNIKTGEVIELTTDWMFDDRYGRFILEQINDWEIVVKNQTTEIKNTDCDHPLEKVSFKVWGKSFKCEQCGEEL